MKAVEPAEDLEFADEHLKVLGREIPWLPILVIHAVAWRPTAHSLAELVFQPGSRPVFGVFAQVNCSCRKLGMTHFILWQYLWILSRPAGEKGD